LFLKKITLHPFFTKKYLNKEKIIKIIINKTNHLKNIYQNPKNPLKNIDKKKRKKKCHLQQ
jgi:hypothetical protein